eukprot:109943-Chlamydomonas_euryale.AAC.1
MGGSQEGGFQVAGHSGRRWEVAQRRLGRVEAEDARGIQVAHKLHLVTLVAQVAPGHTRCT